MASGGKMGMTGGNDCKGAGTAVGGKYVYLPANVGDNVQLCKALYTVQVKQLPAHNRSIPVLDLFTSGCFWLEYISIIFI